MFSQSVKMSLMVLLFGVGIASVTDLQLNFLGSVIAALALITTCISQIVSFISFFYYCCILFGCKLAGVDLDIAQGCLATPIISKNLIMQIEI